MIFGDDWQTEFRKNLDFKMYHCLWLSLRGWEYFSSIKADHRARREETVLL